jgi:hypothetical protein
MLRGSLHSHLSMTQRTKPGHHEESAFQERVAGHPEESDEGGCLSQSDAFGRRIDRSCFKRPSLYKHIY